MKALGKVTLFVLLVVYSIIGFAVFSPLMSVITGNPIFLSSGLLFSFMFALSSFSISRAVNIQWKGIFSRLEEIEAEKTWLLLHSFFTSTMNQIFPIMAGIFSVGGVYLNISVASFAMTFMFIWMILLLSIIGLWFLQSIIGMGYRWFCKGTTLGIRSLTSFALQYFKNKERRGIEYLLKALLLLRDSLKHEELKLEPLNRTIKAARCLLKFESDIPYHSLQTLATELKRFPSVEHLPKAFSTFNIDSKVQWTAGFTMIDRTKRKITEWIIIIAAVLSGLTFLPETARNTLLEILQNTGSTENMQFITGFFLLVVIMYISSITETFYLSPLEAKKFKLSQAD